MGYECILPGYKVAVSTVFYEKMCRQRVSYDRMSYERVGYECILPGYKVAVSTVFCFHCFPPNNLYILAAANPAVEPMKM